MCDGKTACNYYCTITVFFTYIVALQLSVWSKDDINAVIVCCSGIGLTGEMIIIENVTRYCDDIYECVARNGVPPAVSRQIRVTVECK